jgi:hypothetical protein
MVHFYNRYHMTIFGFSCTQTNVNIRVRLVQLRQPLPELFSTELRQRPLQNCYHAGASRNPSLSVGEI